MLGCAPRLRKSANGKSSLAAWLGFAAWLVPLGLLSACGASPPTADDIRRAYAIHVENDPVHERGLRAKRAPAVIPRQDPDCTRDGWSHFDCRIRVIFETPTAPRSQEQTIHIRRDRGAWVIDSAN